MILKELSPGDKFTFRGDDVVCVLVSCSAELAWFEVAENRGFKQACATCEKVVPVHAEFTPRDVKTEGGDKVTIDAGEGEYPIDLDATFASDRMTSASARELAAALIAAADWSDKHAES